MTINLADNNPRIAYTIASPQTVFSVPFEFFSDSDVNVYVNTVLQSEGADYTLTGGDGSTGTVVFVSATSGPTIVITRSTPIERTSDFSGGADINRAALNEQFDILTAMVADLNSKVDRSPTLLDYDVVNYQMTIPVTASRANKYLAFGTTGDLVTTAGTTSNVVVSTFGSTLINVATAAIGLTTLGLTANAGEINKLDGMTSSKVELNRLTGMTATAAELNKLDGATATTAQLNFVTGVTGLIQTQIDTKAPSASPAFTGQITAPNGSAVAPGITGTGDADTGISFASNLVYISTAGVDRMRVNAVGAVSFSSSFGAAGQLLQSASGGGPPVWVTPPLTEGFVSANQLITTGGDLTLAHSLGAQPKLVFCELVCITADAGYAVSDVLMIGNNNGTTADNRYLAVYYNATSVFVRFSSTAACFSSANATTGAMEVLINARWRLRVRAFT